MVLDVQMVRCNSDREARRSSLGRMSPTRGSGEGDMTEPRPPFNNGQSLVAMAHQDADQKAEIERLRELLREAHDVLDADGHQVLSCRIHQALESDPR